jgi:hypothetical protein
MPPLAHAAAILLLALLIGAAVVWSGAARIWLASPPACQQSSPR